MSALPDNLQIPSLAFLPTIIRIAIGISESHHFQQSWQTISASWGFQEMKLSKMLRKQGWKDFLFDRICPVKILACQYYLCQSSQVKMPPSYE